MPYDPSKFVPRQIPPPDRHVRRDGDDYGVQFLTFLPQGQAWPREPGSTLVNACTGLVYTYGFVDARAADLLERDSDPRITTELQWPPGWPYRDSPTSAGWSSAGLGTCMGFARSVLPVSYQHCAAAEDAGHDHDHARRSKPGMVQVGRGLDRLSVTSRKASHHSRKSHYVRDLDAYGRDGDWRRQLGHSRSWRMEATAGIMQFKRLVPRFRGSGNYPAGNYCLSHEFKGVGPNPRSLQFWLYNAATEDGIGLVVSSNGSIVS